MIALIIDLLGTWGLVAHLPGALLDTAIAASAVAAASDEEGGSALLLLAGPAAGGGVYWALFRYYRNTDKSHQFERDTLIESQPVQGTDVKVDEVKGTQRTEISNNNVRSHRKRVQRAQ